MFDKPPPSEDEFLAFALALFFINSKAATYLHQGIEDAALMFQWMADPPRNDLTNLECFQLFKKGLDMYEAIYQSALIDQEVKKATEALYKEMPKATG